MKTVFKGENPKSIFEVGCMNSWFAKQYSIDNDVIVGGIDYEKEYIDGSKKEFPQFKDNFILWDITKKDWPVKSNSYDIVFTVGTLLLIPNPYDVMKEMIRIAKDKLIILEYQDDNETDYGSLGNTSQPKDKNKRVYRDYRKVFDKMGLKYKRITDYSGKTLFKIQL